MPGRSSTAAAEVGERLDPQALDLALRLAAMSTYVMWSRPWIVEP
jgi:hypothetical protein